MPASKSMMQRACAAALLHKGRTTIHNAGVSDDDKAALSIIKALGATVTDKGNNTIEINSGASPIEDVVNCGESGLAARLFIPIAALYQQQIEIKGEGTLAGRSMQLHKTILSKLGVSIDDNNNGKLPFTIKGPLQIRDIDIDGSESSQFLSGLLFAYAFSAKERVVITVENLKSKPYIDLSLEILRIFGRNISNHNYEQFIIDPDLFDIKDEVELTVEGDWSSAVNWLVAGAINGHIVLKGLNIASHQADIAILDILQIVGSDISIKPDIISINSSKKILPFEFDATNCPDMFPALAILAACARGESSITGVHRLLNKESNRIVSIGDMLNEFGIFFSIEDDTMVIEGEGRVEHATIDSYNDHRIVMAAAIAALKAWKPVVITDAEAINKSYPRFFADLTAMGADCILKEQ